MAEFDMAFWSARARQLGAEQVTAVDPAQVVTADWVRMKCLYGCDEPALHRTCPPNSPEPKRTRRVLDGYERALLLRMGPHADTEHHDDLSATLNAAAVDLEGELFLAGFYKAWTMGAGPCELCAQCDTSGACLHPERARPSMEGCGIDVFATVRNAGWQIDVVRDRDDKYSYFALVLVD
jgi:predicted metal-binding protein